MPTDDDIRKASEDRTASLRPEPPGHDARIRAGNVVADRYRVVRRIGFGGMGEVFEAEDTTLERVVALKIIGPVGAEADAAMAEARQAARLRHPGIVAVYDAGVLNPGPAARVYIAMELVAGGERIDEWARRTSADGPKRLAIMGEVCDAIDHANARGVIHGDLKPSNILMDADGAPRVIDFGVSRALGVAESLQPSRGGTPGYSPPEQDTPGGPPLDARADVFALGVITRELMAEHGSAGSIGSQLGAVLDAATQPDRTRRIASARALSENLGALVRGRTAPIAVASPGARARLVGQSLARRHAWAWILCAAIVGFLVANFLFGRIVHRWTPIDRWVSDAMSALPRPSAFGAPLDTVRVVLLRDDDDMESLAARENLEGVRNDDVRSWRRLHGRAMERLAEAHPRAIVWDIIFGSESEFDADLVRGVTGAERAGSGVVVAARDWRLDGEGLPTLSREVIREAGWGVATGVNTGAEPWRVDLVVDRGDGAGATPSLALRALASMRGPDTELDAMLDRTTGEVTLRFWKPVPGVASGRRSGGPDRTVRVSAVESPSPQNASLGIRADDRIGSLIVDIPPDDALGAAAVSYSEIFTLQAQELRERVSGKTVVIGSVRNGQDLWPHPSGRRIPGPWSHACAIDALERGDSVRIATPAFGGASMGAFALVGAACGFAFGGRLVRTIAFVACLALAGAAFTIGLYALSGLFVPCVEHACGAWAAWELGSVGARLRR